MIKGCLITFSIFFFLTIVGSYLYIKKLNTNCRQDHEKVENSFAKLKDKLNERNTLLINKDLSDSIQMLAKKSDSILKITIDADDLLWTEFQLNEKSYQNESVQNINGELNRLKSGYNSDLKSFNSNWTVIPFNFIKIRQKFPEYTFLDIDYGENNQENMRKRKEAEHWIETGEWK